MLEDQSKLAVYVPRTNFYNHPEEKLPPLEEMMATFKVKGVKLDVLNYRGYKRQEIELLYFHIIKAIQKIEKSIFKNVLPKSKIAIGTRQGIRKQYQTGPLKKNALAFYISTFKKIFIMTDIETKGKDVLWSSIIHEYGHHLHELLGGKADEELYLLYDMVRDTERFKDRWQLDNHGIRKQDDLDPVWDYEKRQIPIPPSKPNKIWNLPEIGDPLSDLRLNNWSVLSPELIEKSTYDSSEYILTNIEPEREEYARQKKDYGGGGRYRWVVTPGLYTYTNIETGETIELSSKYVKERVALPSEYGSKSMGEFVAEMFALVVTGTAKKNQKWVVAEFIKIVKKYFH